jgi:parvulin-like peptidyl-prolyl isomerase
MSVYVSRRLGLGIGLVALAVSVTLWSRHSSLPKAAAQSAPQAVAAAPANPVPVPPLASSDYSQRVVAYIYNTIPITREELGEYLIVRLGADRLTNLVNRRIIEHACQQRGVEVTAAEVEAEFAETLKSLGPTATAARFEETVLKPNHKTLYEWKEDAIRPRLLLAKLCRDRIQVTEEDLRIAFDAIYGEKVDCRVIMWPKNEQHVADKMYVKIRDSEAEFDRAARTQADGTLAANGGKITPIGHHTTSDEALEKVAFSLKPGELSHVIGTANGFVVLKCVARMPSDPSKTLEQVRDKLTKEVIDKKLNMEIPRVFDELHKQADPKIFLKKYTTEEELLRDARKELRSEVSKSAGQGGN